MPFLTPLGESCILNAKNSSNMWLMVMRMASQRLRTRLLVHILSTVATLLYRKDVEYIIKHIYNILLTTERNNKDLIRILVAIEDKRFYVHAGFDVYAIMRSVFFYITKQYKSGASTIDQQLVRTVTNNRDRTIARKAKEIILACAINKSFSKTEIANAYLNCAYFGWNLSGITCAARHIAEEKIFSDDDIKFALISMLKYPLHKYKKKDSFRKICARINYARQRLDSLPEIMAD